MKMETWNYDGKKNSFRNRPKKELIGLEVLETGALRVRRGDAQEKSLDMLKIRKPDIDYVKMSESMGVPASRATSAEEFHQQFSAAMAKKGPHFIDAHVDSIAPATIKMIRENLVL